MPFFDRNRGTDDRTPLSNQETFCIACVYYALNLDRTMYQGKGVAELPDDGCSLDFMPGDKGCKEMKTSNCSVRKSK